MSKLFSFFKKSANEFNSPASSYNQTRSNGFHLSFKRFRLSKQLIAIILIFLVGAMIFGFWFKKTMSDKNYIAASSTGDQEKVTPPYATKQLDREFSFPLRDDKGKEVSTFKYIVQNAELTREIIVKGQKGTAVKGRTFLIINLKINNDSKQRIQINSRDYIRLMVNGNDKELLAPDIHNDPVEVQPISTKFTRLGFAINDSDKNLKLQIGEIEGDKQFIELSF